MRFRFRFSVASLLLLVTATALLLGYTEWRRRDVIRKYEALRAEGLTLQPLSGTWWPKGPPTALIMFRPRGSNMLSHHRSRYTIAEAIARYRDWHARLKNIGVNVVQLGVFGAHGNQELILLDDPNDLVKLAQ